MTRLVEIKENPRYDGSWRCVVLFASELILIMKDLWRRGRIGHEVYVAYAYVNVCRTSSLNDKLSKTWV